MSKYLMTLEESYRKTFTVEASSEEDAYLKADLLLQDEKVKCTEDDYQEGLIVDCQEIKPNE